MKKFIAIFGFLFSSLTALASPSYRVTYGLNARYSAGSSSAEFVITGPGLSENYHSNFIYIGWESIKGDPFLVAAKLEQALNEEKISLKKVKELLNRPQLDTELNKILAEIPNFALTRFKVSYGLNARYSLNGAGAEFVITGPGLKDSLQSYLILVTWSGIKADPYQFAAKLEQALNENKVSIKDVKALLENPFLETDLILTASKLPNIELKQYKVSYGLNARYNTHNVAAEFIVTGPGLKESFHSHTVHIGWEEVKGDPHQVAMLLENALNNKLISISDVQDFLLNPDLTNGLSTENVFQLIRVSKFSCQGLFAK